MNFIKTFIFPPSLKKTWISFSGTLLFFLSLALLEFGVLFAVKANNSFGNPFLQALPMFLAMAAIPLITGGRAAKIYLFAVAFFAILIEITTAVIAICFKVNFDTDFLLVLSATSFAETVEFIETYYSWGIVTAVISGFLLSGILLFFAVRKSEFHATLHLRIIGVLLCLPFVIATTRYCLIGKSKKAFDRTNVSRIIAGAVNFYHQWETLADAVKKPQLPPFSGKIKRDAPVTGIIVIGESATRRHFSIYGYDRPTTPELSKRDDLILFTDAISGWGSTTNALRLMLTCSTVEHLLDSRCTIIDVFKKAGYRVVMFSNQFRMGRHDSPITLMFFHVDRMSFLQEKARRKIYDDSLIPLLDEELQKNDGRPLIVFLHMIGSHDAPNNRYPQDFDPFSAKTAKSKKERMKNEYDNSIAFTDRILGQIAQRVATTKNPAFMLYVSDHGSAYADGKTRSSRDKNPQIYEVPMILQFNSAYRTHYPETVQKAKKNASSPIQTDCLFWTMASLAGLQGNDPLEHFSPLSDNFQPPKERKIAEGTCLYQP